MAGSSSTQYVLGSADAELRRLDAQAQMTAPPTELLLRAAGIEAGMSVLDLGTGLGHVAFAAAELVGPGGRVLGIDQEPRMLAVAEQRRAAGGRQNVEFWQADVRTFTTERRFDAIVGRLILFHLPGAVDVVRHYAGALRHQGRLLAIDFDIGTVRTEPQIPLFAAAADWVMRAFRAAGANPVVGARLGPILRAAGLRDVSTLGIQPYLAPTDPVGPALVAGVIETLAPKIVSEGIASEQQLELDTLQERLTDALTAADAVLLLPGVVGAWGIALGS